MKQAPAVTATELRAAWSARSLASTWAFASDWDSPAVDAVVEAITADCDVFPAAQRLGNLRAISGVTLGETLADIDQLITLVSPSFAEILRRAVSLGWADRAVGPGVGTVRSAHRAAVARVSRASSGRGVPGVLHRGLDITDEYALTVVRVELTGRNIWQRVLPMIHVGESLRVVFDAGETLARLGEPMAVALVRRTPTLDRRVQLLGRLIASRTDADPDSRIAAPRIWIEPLPNNYTAARALINELGR